MTNQSEEPGHGFSAAAWIAVTIMLIGVFVGTLFLFLDVLPLVYLGAVLILVGLVVGWLLARAGFGVNGSKTAHLPPRCSRSSPAAPQRTPSAGRRSGRSRRSRPRRPNARRPSTPSPRCSTTRPVCGS